MPNTTQKVDPIDALRASFDAFRDAIFEDVKNLSLAQVRMEKGLSQVEDAVKHVACLREDKFNDFERRMDGFDDFAEDTRKAATSMQTKAISTIIGLVVVVVSVAVAFTTVRSTAEANQKALSGIVAGPDAIPPRLTIVETKQGSLNELTHETSERLTGIGNDVSEIKSDVRVLKEGLNSTRRVKK